MKNLKDIIHYVERALSTKEVSDLQVAYEIMLENQRREAEQPEVKNEVAPEVKDFEQDAIAVMKQQDKEDKKLQKEFKKIEKNIKTIPSSPGRPAVKPAPKPVKRKRKTRTRRRGR
tara:strand:+ start:1735 stop:2082 length:348 start_codon:yes stop_codon:yes gene_type:complete